MSKVSKNAANYTPYSATNKCRDCTMFQRTPDQPNSCITVEGSINPSGHCKYFERKNEAKPK